jgi:hypothetical protein
VERAPLHAERRELRLARLDRRGALAVEERDGDRGADGRVGSMYQSVELCPVIAAPSWSLIAVLLRYGE